MSAGKIKIILKKVLTPLKNCGIINYKVELARTSYPSLGNLECEDVKRPSNLKNK